MFRTSATRGKAMLIATFATLLLLGAVYAAIITQGEEKVRLGFGPRDGYGTASSHGQYPSDVLGIVVDTVDAYEDYVRSLEVFQPLPTLRVDGQNPLLAAEVQVDADQPNETYVVVGPLGLTLGGLLQEVPPADVSDTLRALEAAGWNLLGDGEGGPVPTTAPGGDEEPFVFEVGDREHTYATIVLHPVASAVEVIVHPMEGFGGAHIVSTPWVVELRDDGDALVELWVRNPVTSFSAAAEEEVVVKNFACKNGKCLPKGVVRNTCREAGACPAEFRASAAYESGRNALPGTLVHLWANDTIHGGAGLEILGESASFAVPDWHGNPFTEEGVYVEDESGARLAGVAVRLPTSADRSLHVAVTGAVVEQLHGDGLGHDEDLSEWRFGVQVGDETIGTETLFPVLDMASAVLVEVWTDADGDVKAASVGTLRERGGLVRVVEDEAGDVHATIEALGVDVRLPKSEIGPVGGLLDGLGGLTAPAEEAVIKIMDRTNQEVWAAVRVVEGAAGCELQTLGCLNMVIGRIEGLVPGVPVAPPEGSPDPEVLVGDVQTEGDRVVLWVNTIAGTVLGYVPDPSVPAEPCVPGLPGTPPVCGADVPAGDRVLAAVAGLLAEPVGAVTAFVEDPEEGSVVLQDREGNEWLRVDGGGLRVAGVGASLGPEGTLFTVYGPDGHETCVRATTPPDEVGVPGLEVGCDGVAGQMLRVEPGVDYALEDGRLAYLAVRDPTTGDAVLEYTDNGVAAVLTVRSPVLEQSVQLPSEAVTVIGDPLTSSTFTIRLAGQAVPLGSQFSEVKVLRQAYDDARRVVSGLPVGSEVGVLFRLVEAPDADVRVNDGFAHLVGAQGQLQGNDWLSGLRDNAFRVTAQVDGHTPDRLDVVYEVGALPSYGASPSALLPVSGVSADQTTRIHEGAVPASVLRAANEGAVLHVGLAWVERVGPVALVLWDDNAGQGYRYSLDTRAPPVSLSVPTVTDEAVFAVSWSSAGDAGSGLGHFRVQSALGASPAPEAWVDWIGMRPSGEAAFADFNGAPGSSYSFRASACDLVGNCAPWSAVRNVEVVKEAPPQPAAPSLQIVAPLPGASLSGVSDLAWKVTYDGNATAIVNVAYQRAGASDWVPVYSGAAGTAPWRTDVLVDGTYTLRFVVTDGTYSATRSVSVALSNGVTEATLESVRAANAAEPGGASEDPGAPDAGPSSPSWLVPVLSVGAVLVVGGAVLGVVLGRRRRVT